MTTQTLSAQENSGLDKTIDNLINAEYNTLTTKLSTVKQQIDETELLRLSLPEPNSDKPLDTSFESTLLEAESLLNRQSKANKDAQAKLVDYQVTHGITEPEDAPTPVLAIFKLVLMGLLETLANTTFFYSAGMVSSAANALTTAFLISLVNITSSTLAGFLIGRYLKYGVDAESPEQFRTVRLIAKCAFVFFVLVNVLFQITCGLIRSQQNFDILHHGLAAYGEMLSSPHSVFLIILGTSMSVFSFYKGLTAFGRYPKLNRYTQKAQDASNAFEDTYLELIEEIEELCEERIENAKAQREEIIQTTCDYNHAVALCEQSISDFSTQVEQAKSHCSSRINATVRKYNAITGEGISIDIPSRIALFGGLVTMKAPPLVPERKKPVDTSALEAAKSNALKRVTHFYQSNQSQPA